MNNLQSGDTGRDVEVWQRFLAQVWIVEFDTMLPGVFDEATEQATRAFQEDQGLDVTGVVDRLTIGKANLRGLQMLDSSIYKGPTKTTALACFAVLVMVSVLSQCMLMPKSTANLGGIQLPLAPGKVPGTPAARTCPGWFC